MLNKLFLFLLALILLPLSVYSQKEIDYFPQKARKYDVVLTIENIIMKNNMLLFRLNAYNNGKDSVYLIKPDTSFIENSVFIILLYDKETNKRYDIHLSNSIGQLACISIKLPLKQLATLAPNEGFYQDFSLPFKARKNRKYTVQVILDYDYIITSPIPLKNLVQQELKSNIIDVISN